MNYIIKNSSFATYSVNFNSCFTFHVYWIPWIIRIAYYFDIFQIIYMPILAHNMGIVYGPSRKKVGYFILMLLVIVTS